MSMTRRVCAAVLAVACVGLSTIGVLSTRPAALAEPELFFHQGQILTAGEVAELGEVVTIPTTEAMQPLLPIWVHDVAGVVFTDPAAADAFLDEVAARGR